MATLKPKQQFEKLKAFARTSQFAGLYALVAFAVLTATTVFWATLGARLQAGNADQLVNSYLFSSSQTFHNATLPGAHTFLIKWPLFMLVKLFSYSGGAFATFTVLLTLVTVWAFAALLYRIERRPLVLGTIWLALASVLMLVPALPFAGGLLPLNMAMLTTRNIEYILYIVSIALVTRPSRWRGWQFWLGSALLALLIASDKLFLYLGLGGALAALVVYAFANRWDLVSLSKRWLSGGAIGGAVGLFILWAINAAGVVHISNASSGGPYGAVHGLHNLGLAIIFAGLNLLSNFGANGAFNTTVLHEVPHDVYSRFTGVSGFSFLVNLLILLFGLFVVYRLVRLSLTPAKVKGKKIPVPDFYSRLALTMVWAAAGAFAIFIFTDHYYAGDGRYLSISLFAVFISIAEYLRKKNWRSDLMLLAGLCLSLSILLALPTTLRTYRADHNALAGTNSRNSLIADALSHHPVTTLEGDYWRVIPTKAAAGNKLNVTPLDGCLAPRQVLSSKSWQPDPATHSFAYLISFDSGIKDGFPACDLNKVIDSYGRPNASAVIAGSLSQPQESLLFYDHGTHKSAPKTAPPNKSPATVLPISLNQLPYSTCNVPTDINIVAHQDDDLLFMNPDILHDIQQGHCVRTVYVTAGDDGSGKFYWLSREAGSEAAYSTMLGTKDLWVQRIVKLNNHEYVTVANPTGSSKISLIFMHLPDGNLDGQGFPANSFESLAKLDSGKIPVMNAVDGQSSYSSTDLVNAITNLMHFYQPTEINTQANYISKTYPDHSDHMAVGRFVKKAYTQYEIQQYNNQVSVPISFYIGYPIHAMAPNVSGKDLQSKQAAFAAYAQYDKGVCTSVTTCQEAPVYNDYLTREYKNAY